MRSIGVTKNGRLDADVFVTSLADLPPDAFDRLLRGYRRSTTVSFRLKAEPRRRNIQDRFGFAVDARTTSLVGTW